MADNTLADTESMAGYIPLGAEERLPTTLTELGEHAIIYAKDEAIAVLEGKYGIEFYDSERFPIDEGLLSCYVDWLVRFDDLFPGFLEKSPCKIPAISCIQGSRIKDNFAAFQHVSGTPEVKAIFLNESLHWSLEEYAQKLQQTINSNFHPPNSTFVSMFAHEMGHHLTKSMRWIAEDENWVETFLKECIDELKQLDPSFTGTTYGDMKDQVSEYSEDSWGELFSEVFGECYTAEEPRIFAQIFGSKLSRRIKEVI